MAMKTFIFGLTGLVVAGCSFASPEQAPTESLPEPRAAAKPVCPSSIGDLSSEPDRFRYEIIARYPHDPLAYTQGLLVQDGHFIESTGRYGESVVRRVEIETGDVIQEYRLPDNRFGEGVTQIGDELVGVTWQSGEGYVLDAQSFDLKDTFEFKGEGWGLTTWKGIVLLSDGTPDLRWLDPEDKTVIETQRITHKGRPLGRLNELENVRGEIWGNVWQTNYLVRIDPCTGVVTGVADLSGLRPNGVVDTLDGVLNGIAWDANSDKLYVTGKLWPVLYEIKLIHQKS